MPLRRFTDFILQGRLRAIGTAFILAFVPLIGSISILIAALVTLRKNAYEGVLVTIAASIPLAAQYVITPSNARTDIFIGMLIIALLGNLLIWFFAVMLRRYGNWNHILEVALFLGVIVVGSVHVLYPNVQVWWEKQLTAYFIKTLDVANAAATDADPALQEMQTQIVSVAKYYATGFVATMVLLNAILQLVIARGWQSVVFNSGGLRKELLRIRLSYIASGLFVVLLALNLFKNNITTDILPILYGVFAMAGLSLVHYLIDLAKKGNWLWVMLVYLGLIWLFPYSFVVLAFFALFDTWLDFRKRASVRFGK